MMRSLARLAVGMIKGIRVHPPLSPTRAPRLDVMRLMEFVGVIPRLGARAATHTLVQVLLDGGLGVAGQFEGATRRLGVHRRWGLPLKPPTGGLRPIVRGKLPGKRRKGAASRGTSTELLRPRRSEPAWQPPPGRAEAAIPEGLRRIDSRR